MVDFGKKLRHLRKQKGMLQKELAEYLNVTSSAVSNYERGAQYPTVDKLEQIARLFRVSSDYLLGLTKEKEMIYDDLTDEQCDYIYDLMQLFRRSNHGNSPTP